MAIQNGGCNGVSSAQQLGDVQSQIWTYDVRLRLLYMGYVQNNVLYASIFEC